MSEIIKQLRSIIGGDNHTILEIGSCEGEDSVWFLKIFNNARVFCFEPDPKNCSDHRKLINNNRCTLIEMAITDTDGDIVFHRSGGRKRRASGSIRKPKEHLDRHPWCTFNEKIIVPGITLDTWCKKNNISSIDLIWADVNGAETSMIGGASETLRFTKYLYTEFGPDDAEIYEGGITQKQLMSLLPKFEKVLVNNNNILLCNKELT